MSAAVAYLFVAVAVAGGSGMALEMAASRQLLPLYGDSHLIWANVIGIFLSALTLGYFAGGELADRRPSRRLMLALIAISGLWTAAIPVVGSSLLRSIQGSFAATQTGFILSSLLGVLALFALPTFLLGCVPPFGIRLALSDVRVAGKVAGSVYAISTVGSMLGTFAPVLWLMPDFGVRSTFAVISAVLLLTALAGVVLPERPRAAAAHE
jgi:predicted membrane-bound spermidine synthase